MVKEPIVVEESIDGHKLIELEEAVFDEGGMWVFVNKLAPQEDDDDKKKKKGGGDEPSSVYAKAWLDTSQFKDPGCQEVEL